MGGLLPEGATGWALLALACYVAVSVFVDLGLYLGARTRSRRASVVSLLVVVENQEQQIEGLVRALTALRDIGSARVDAEIIVVDAGSEDDTPLIMERLCQTHGSVRYIRVDTQSPWEVGMHNCGSRVALLVDARGATQLRPVLGVVTQLMGARSRAAQMG